MFPEIKKPGNARLFNFSFVRLSIQLSSSLSYNRAEPGLLIQ
jgi:hypothetical protein